MSPLPNLKAKQLLKVLKELGFVETRSRGSHVFFAHQDGRTTVVPIHAGETLGKGLLRAILREIDLTVDDLNKLLNK